MNELLLLLFIYDSIAKMNSTCVYNLYNAMAQLEYRRINMWWFTFLFGNVYIYYYYSNGKD